MRNCPIFADENWSGRIVLRLNRFYREAIESVILKYLLYQNDQTPEKRTSLRSVLLYGMRRRSSRMTLRSLSILKKEFLQFNLRKYLMYECKL